MMKERALDRYPDISDHGLIGDLQTAALVTSDGTIDFFCCPRFLDPPSIFASLLDHDNGGYFRVSPAGGHYVSKQLYFPDTAMLITRFMTPDGVGEVLDFMPVIQDSPPTGTGWSGTCGWRAAPCSSPWTFSRGSTTAAPATRWRPRRAARSSGPNGMELTLHATAKHQEPAERPSSTP